MSSPLSLTGFTHYFRLITGKYFYLLKISIIAICFIPFLILVWQYQHDQLGTNPLAYLTYTSGHLSLIFLLITLSITPLKRLAARIMIKLQLRYGKRLIDWNWIIKLRKIFGLFCFFYAAIHLSIYLWFDQGLEWEYILEDIAERPFILVGMVSFFFLLLMAITSFKFFIQKLKKKWRIIHMSIYPVAILCVLHYSWLSKMNTNELIIYALFTFILLSYRLLIWTGILKVMQGDTGMEVSNRSPLK